ncbi:MAG: GGDEF domain-containing protein [Eubacteriales bacterium]
MNQLSTTTTRRTIPLIIKYLFLSVIVIVILTGIIVWLIQANYRDKTEIEVNNLYEIAETQIASQYNNIVGDALNIEAITISEMQGTLDSTGESDAATDEELKEMYEKIIENTEKYAAITLIKKDGTRVEAGSPKETEVEDFMNQIYSTPKKDPILYAYISQFNHSKRVKEVTFNVTIPIIDLQGYFAGYLILEPKLEVIIKDVERALENANIYYELLSIETSDAVYIYSDIDKTRGSEFRTLSDVQGTEVSRKVVYSDTKNGSFESIDGQAFFQKFEMPLSNFYGPKHIYIAPESYIFLLTLPAEYYSEITEISNQDFFWIAIGVAACTLLITMLLYNVQSNRRKFTQKTTKMAQVDTLTGLLNRAYFTELFENMIEEDPEAKYAILFMDLDGFKDINDSYGHNMGDKVLRVVANRLVMSARREDLVSRFGGDEFAMLIAYNSIDQVRYVANKVVKAIDEVMIIDDNEYNVGVSVGVAIYPEHARSVDDLYKVADNAMYKVKYSTKNNYLISKGDEKII